MTKKKKQTKQRPETYERKLTLHPLTIEEALKIALETKPPKKQSKKE
jgi:hypothetical protein